MRMLAWLAVLLVACVPARKRVPGDVVRNIHFDGNGGLFSGHNDLQLRTQMEQRASRLGLMLFPLNYFIDPAAYVPDILAEDAYRLEVWYAHQGYLDARVMGFTARHLRKRGKRRAGVVDIKGFVDTGALSSVRNFEVSGSTPATTVWANLVKRTGQQRSGRAFNLAGAELDRATLQAMLQRHGYAYADVQLELNAHPKEQVVDLDLYMKPGIFSSFGPVTVEGSKAVKKKFIEQNLRIDRGEPYRLDELVAAQNRLFAMNTFSLVTVKPDLSDPTAKEVPITVKVTENKFRTLRFGVGLETEGLRNWAPYVQTQFRHAHLFHQLIRMQVKARVGLSGYSPSPAVETEVFPVWRFSGALTYPRIAGQRVAQQLEVKVERDLDQSIARFDNPEFDLRTLWRPTDELLLQMGPHFETFSYIDLDPTLLDAARVLYGPDFDGTYRLASIDLGLTLDWRDDPLSSRRGSFLSTTVRYAFPLLDGDDPHFLAFTGDWRIFRPIRLGKDVPFTLASRLHGKVLLPLGDDGLPYPEKAFLGGASNMRGYPARALGSYQAFVTGGIDAQRVSYISEGGSLGLVLQEELRYHTSNGFTYAAFADVATLSDPFTTGSAPQPVGVGILSGVRIAGGLGARYGSPIGPIRLDLSIRPRYAEDDCPANFPNCEQGTRLQRRLDVVRAIDGTSKLPGLMFFFAFGESI